MKAPWILAAIAGTGCLAVGGSLAAPLAPALHRPSLDLVLIQDSDLVTRLWQHRSIIEEALLPPGQITPAEPIVPQTRALQPSEPLPQALPQEPGPPPVPALAPEPDPASTASARVSCEEAAAIVLEYGFSEITETRCSGELYWFSAMRDDMAYAIGITAGGEIAEVRRQH